MANKKISELPYINVTKISGNTLVPLVTYFSAATGDTVHTYISDLQTYLISGLTGNTDVFVTGGTYSAGTITITNNTGGTFNITGVTFSGGSSVVGDYLPLSGGTVSGGTQFTAGLTANTISATTYLNLPINTDVFVTGGTYSSGDATFTNNTGGTFNVTGFYTGQTSYVNSLTTGVGLSADTTTGNITIINTDPDQTVTISGGTGITTGGTYPNFTITNSAPDQTVTLSEGTNISVTGTYPNFTLDVTGLTDNDIYVTGFTYDDNNTFTISKNSGSSLNATFNLVSGLTVNGNLSVTGNTNLNNLSANTISATTYQNLPLGIYGTGLTFNTGNYDLTLDGQNGTLDTISLSILASDLTVTGGTYDPNTGIATFTNNTGGTFNVTGFLTGMTDTFVTGGTYSAGTITFTNTSGGTFEVTGLTTGDTTTITGATSVGTGLTIFDSVVNRNIQINSITADTTEKVTTTLNSNTIELGVNEQNFTLWDLVVQGNRLLSGNVSYVSGLTFSVSPLEYLINGTIYEITSATTVTLNSGDTLYDRIDVIFADISGNTGVLEGTPSENPEKPIVDGDSQVEVTFVLVPANSTTPDINEFIIYNENVGPPSEWTFGVGGSQSTRISGNSTDDAYSGTTSIKVSGLTVANYNTFFRLTGDTVLDTNNYATLQFAMKNLSANTTTSRIRLRFLTTGGTQNGNAVFMNAAGSAGYVQYSRTNVSTWQLISIPLWRFYLTNTNTQVLEVAFYPLGSPLGQNYYFDLFEFVEGTSSSPPSNSWTTIKGDSATTIIAPNPNATLTISGGTNISSSISGTSTVVLNLDNNINLNGVTASTISATTYQNLPSSTFTGGTVNGSTNFTNGLTANTISATTYQNLPISGLTEGNNINISGSNGNYTISVTGSTSNISGDYLPLSGGTVTGNTVFTENISVTGGTGINWFSGNTSTDLLRVTQTGVGNAFVVDDSTNPDSTPFVINSGGSVSIGTTSVFSVGGGAETKLNISTGSSGVATTGLSVSTPVIIESTVGTSIGLFNPDVANSQMYFGTPSDAFGAFLRWDYTNRNLILSTANGTGKLIFQTANAVEAARIDQSGNFGIGLTGATQKLEVSGNTLVYGNLELTSENTTSIGNILRFRDSDSVVTPTTEQFIGKIEFFSNETTGGGTGVKSYIAGVQDASANSSIIFATTGGTGTLTGSPTTLIGERMRIDEAGNVGIGTSNPTQKLEVSGNVLVSNGLTASTATINGNLTVTGNTNVRAFTGTTGYISGSGQNILTVIGSGNSTTSPLFTVQGSSGELFSVNDSLVGSLFSVNDISGLPILEVFSDNTTLMGSYLAPSLNTTTRVTLTAGTNTVYSIPTSAYTGAFIDYTLVSTGTTGARAGNIMTIWSGTTAQYTETSTNDIGTTTGVTFSVAVSGNNAVLSSSATTTGWTLKTIVRSI
jgi:hypothetical protein